MKTLIIDNYDSFTYNLFHIADRFSDICDVIRRDKLTLNSIKSYDKIIISPGPSLPEDHPIIFDVLDSYSSSKSILGICLGHQAIGQYFGGDIINMDRVKHGVQSVNNIIIQDDLFQGLPLQFFVGHYHSWSLNPNNVSDSLYVTSMNDDAEIMSIKHKNLDICGLQFHPESILTEFGDLIIRNWLKS